MVGPALCEGTRALCVRDYREASVAIWVAVTVVDTLEVLSMERLMCSFAAVRRNQGLAGHLLPAVFSEGCTRWTLRLGRARWWWSKPGLGFGCLVV